MDGKEKAKRKKQRDYTRLMVEALDQGYKQSHRDGAGDGKHVFLSRLLHRHVAIVESFSRLSKRIRLSPHLFGPRGLHLLHLVGLHLGLHLLPVLAHGALFGSDPGGLFGGLPHGGDVAHGQLGRRLHGLTCGHRDPPSKFTTWWTCRLKKTKNKAADEHLNCKRVRRVTPSFWEWTGRFGSESRAALSFELSRTFVRVIKFQVCSAKKVLVEKGRGDADPNGLSSSRKIKRKMFSLCEKRFPSKRPQLILFGWFIPDRIHSFSTNG